MTSDEELTAFARHDDADATLLAVGNKRQVRIGQNVLTMEFRMTTVRHVEHIVETAEDGQSAVEGQLWEDAEHLLRQRILGYAVVEIKSGLSSPTYI